ncbi:MAG TPA: GatB/YqeY domain-containing protein [Blastocatellia bacterium]|nr:GatB/YqeY domain-containing protein [Blastocatellia bacterium]
MPIVDRINADLTEAMKAREAERLSALRMVKTALKLRETELPGGVDDAEAIKVLNTLLKQRRDAAEQFRTGGREELALKEENEARIIQAYLPAAASEDDISQAVGLAIAEAGASSMKDMGAVMKAVRAKLEGKTVDGKLLSDLVKAKLSAI